MELFPASPSPQAAAAAAAASLTRAMAEESARRVSLHREMFDATWRSLDYTPEQFFAALGSRGARYLALGGESVEHLSRLAAAAGLTLADYLPEADYVPPREYTIHPDGTVTLAPEEEE